MIRDIPNPHGALVVVSMSFWGPIWNLSKMLLLQGQAWGLVPDRGSQEVSSQNQDTWLLVLARRWLCDLGEVT